MGLWFVLGGLACSTSIYIVFGKLGKTRPPIFPRDKFKGFPTAGVANCRVVMIHFEKVSAKGIIFWNIDVASIEYDSIF